MTLNERELRIIELVAQGLKNSEIAPSTISLGSGIESRSRFGTRHDDTERSDSGESDRMLYFRN